MGEQAQVPIRPVAAPDEPMGFMEALILFGGLAIIFDGIGAVIGRISGLGVPVLSCLNIFLYIGAGFVAARYATKAAGVWASIAVASVDLVLGQLLVAAILPVYTDLSAQLTESVPTGYLAFLIVGVALISLISVLITGGICGLIGSAIAQSASFRPRYSYPTE